MNGVTFHYYARPSYRELVAQYGFVLLTVTHYFGVSTVLSRPQVVVSRGGVRPR